MVESAGRRSLPKFQKQSNNIDQKTTQCSTHESRENLDSFSSSILSEIPQTEYVRPNQISKKKF